METKEQKIERLKKEIRRNNQLRKRYKHSRYAMNLRDENKDSNVIIVKEKDFEMKKLFDPGICYFAMQNPCTDCQDKSKCMDCKKSCEYVLKIHTEIIKNMKGTWCYKCKKYEGCKIRKKSFVSGVFAHCAYYEEKETI